LSSELGEGSGASPELVEGVIGKNKKRVSLININPLVLNLLVAGK